MIYRLAICFQTIYRQTLYFGEKMSKQEPLTESYFYILLCLYKENLHGYAIMQKSKELSNGKVSIGAGTMYGATSNMMKKGWIEELLEEGKDERGKRLYKLTEDGKSILMQEVTRLENLVSNAKSIIGNIDKHFS